MKVILSQDVKELGKKGQIKEVSEGYARNFLLPKGLAVLASEGNIRSIEQVKKAQESKAERGKTDALKLAAKLKDCTLHLLTRSGEGGKRFGSVTTPDLAKAL
ncbi:MAG: 50S ribosomal protein L9, partial [bacterium]|nr:50S ribosomal protein L9 [bacterium]